MTWLALKRLPDGGWQLAGCCLAPYLARSMLMVR